jgi:hypothetical protein
MNTEEALAYFDSLPPVDIDFMLGNWRGQEFPTQHSMDGLLTASGWQGKQFESADVVHPLIFHGFRVNPDLLPMNLTLLEKVPRTNSLSHMVKVMKPLLETKKPKAKLRMLNFRNKVTCGMLYNGKPIIDYFAKIDEKTVLGLMTMKGSQPYFFKLMRTLILAMIFSMICLPSVRAESLRVYAAASLTDGVKNI